MANLPICSVLLCWAALFSQVFALQPNLFSRADDDVPKVWIDKTSCDKYDGLEDAIRTALKRVSIRTYYARKSLDLIESNREIKKWTLDIMTQSRSQSMVKRLQDVYTTIDQMCANDPLDISADEWKEQARPNKDIAIYCDLDHVQRWDRLPDFFFDSKGGRYIPEKSWFGGVLTGKENPWAVSIGSDAVHWPEQIDGYENAPEYIAFGKKFHERHAEVGDWWLMKDNMYSRAVQASKIKDRVQTYSSDGINSYDWTPMDTLMTLEHVLLHEILHTTIGGAKQHSNVDGFGFHAARDTPFEDKSHNTEVANIVAHGLEMLTRVGMRAGSKGDVQDWSKHLGRGIPPIDAPGIEYPQNPSKKKKREVRW